MFRPAPRRAGRTSCPRIPSPAVRRGERGAPPLSTATETFWRGYFRIPIASLCAVPPECVEIGSPPCSPGYTTTFVQTREHSPFAYWPTVHSPLCGFRSTKREAASSAVKGAGTFARRPVDLRGIDRVHRSPWQLVLRSVLTRRVDQYLPGHSH